jgi:hypothetical protein
MASATDSRTLTTTIIPKTDDPRLMPSSVRYLGRLSPSFVLRQLATLVVEGSRRWFGYAMPTAAWTPQGCRFDHNGRSAPTGVAH